MRAADPDAAGLAAMNLGDLVIYHGRRHVVRGFSRMGTTSQHVHLEDVETGEQITVPLDEVEPVPCKP
jgi:hypothetical protein